MKTPLIITHEKGVVITKVAWWTDETVLAACSDGTIRFWLLDGMAQPPPEPITILKVDAEVRDMELSKLATGQEILTVAAGTKVNFFDLQDAKLLKSYPMPIHFKNEGGATLHPAGTKFVAAGSDLWVRVFDYETGQELECHKGHHGPIRCMRYAPDGTTYATGSEDGTIRLWKTDAQQ
eukprot:CAMPEP_0202443716 /NCGR_PEP_ID=MMETSP1360-20130828/2904_1 /ASSEMBLY_ACC=CAM_ASM_000848 /TAXON_ID=515479 /ORGANISM="Licmophora paradoxa, Strain CCMP2313" /LENGTH=178 /DNA_ID=CAMNT_0049059467 /DNA_START=334 /DNA_END=873 /DNA_ORIENTATION=-